MTVPQYAIFVNPFSFGGVSLVSSRTKSSNILPSGKDAAANLPVTGPDKRAKVEETNNAEERLRVGDGMLQGRSGEVKG